MKLDTEEADLLQAYESGLLLPVASKDELAALRASACATAIKDQCINIRLSSAGDLRDQRDKPSDSTPAAVD